MQTIAINVMNLCAPCANRCRYCLLSYDGAPTGVDINRSMNYAKRFYDWIQLNRPDLSFLFGFGYSMEHPKLLEIIRFCQSIGSVTGEFLQFDGMAMRSDHELKILLQNLRDAGIRLIDLTFYGTEIYHDRFAARHGDFRLMMNTLRAANRVGLDVSISIPLTHENFKQVEHLMTELNNYQISKISCFVPHTEGRGKSLDSIRFTAEDYEQLSSNIKSKFNRSLFRPEAEWVREQNLPDPQHRVLTLTLSPENIDKFEGMNFSDTITYLEQLDNTYYQTIPSFPELLQEYGDPNGNGMYSARDLYLCYQRRYIQEQGIHIYDINDERQCFSRRI